MTVRAYHFVGDTLRDGRPVPPDGAWLEYDGPVVIRGSGLHACRHPMDAMRYAPGPVLCLVDCADIVAAQADTLVCRKRLIVARFDATRLLRSYARWCALSVAYLWDAPPVVSEYLETGDDVLRAASLDAVRHPAWYAAWRTAQYAAWRTAQYAAWRTAWHAVMDTAWDAAWGAGRGTYRDLFQVSVDDVFAKMGVAVCGRAGR